jgi:hypothetical protein
MKGIVVVGSKPTLVDPRILRGYLDLARAAHYCGFSKDQFKVLIAQGVFPRGRPLTRDGKLIFKIADLDAAIERAWRTRKPRRTPRGIIRQRLERRRREQQNEKGDR